jgi:hypothetical protein
MTDTLIFLTMMLLIFIDTAALMFVVWLGSELIPDIVKKWRR